MPSTTALPKIGNQFACIVHKDEAALGAVISSYLYTPGAYFPVFLFPKVEVPRTDDPAFLSDSYVALLMADQISVLVGNALNKMGTGYVVLAGLTEAQKSYLTIPNQSEVIEIANISEIEVKLGPVSPPANGEVRCRTRDLLNGLHIAQEQRKRLVLDEDAEVASEASSSRKGVVVIERVADASPVIAINYASSVGASVFLVDALSHKEGREVQRWIQDWKEDDNDCQLERVRNAVQQRIGNIDFARFEYATFFTEGLPYSFVLENVIPCSHVLLSVRPDMFIVTTFWMPKAYPFTLALCFRPCFSPTRRRTGCAISSRPTTFIYVL